MKYKQFILCFSFLQLLNADCINSSLADANEDGMLNIIDVLATVDSILSLETHSQEEILLFDVNSDGTIDILDVLKLVHKILEPEPIEIFISDIESSLFELIIQWQFSESHNFSRYEIYISSSALS